MPNNEFDQLLGETSKNQVKPTNEFDSFLADEKESKIQQVQATAQVTKGIDPERAARTAKIAREIGVSENIIHANFDQANEDYQVADIKPSDLMTRAPKFTDFLLREPMNTPLVKDDVPAMVALEESLDNHSYGGDFLRAIAHGTANMFSGLAKLPAVMASQGPYTPEAFANSPDAQLAAYEARNQPIPKSLYDNEVTQFFDDKAKQFEPRDIGLDVIQSFRDGNKAKAARALSLQVVANIPQLAMIAATRGAGLGVMFAGSAGSKMAQNLEAGVEPDVARTNALLNATIETGIESVGGIGANPLKSTLQQVTKNLGPRAALDVVKESMKGIIKTAGEEGAEEFVTSVSQDLLDYGMGVNPDAMKGIVGRALNAGLVGAGAGFSVGAPIGALNARQEYVRANTEFAASQKADQAKATYEQVLASREATKTNQRAPQKVTELIADKVRGTEIENVHIPVSGFESYAQSQNKSATDIAQELGILDEYNRAFANNSDMQVSFAEWTEKVQGTDHGTGLADDIKFDALGDTVNEVKSAREEARALAKQATEQTKLQDEKFKSGVSFVEEDVSRQLVEAGYSKRDAKANAAVLSSIFKSAASRTGVGPAELYTRYGLKIQNQTEMQAAADTIALNQSEKPDVMDKLNELFPVTGDVKVDDAAFAELQKDPARYKEYLSLLDQLGTRDERARSLNLKDRFTVVPKYNDGFDLKTDDSIVSVSKINPRVDNYYLGGAAGENPFYIEEIQSDSNSRGLGSKTLRQAEYEAQKRGATGLTLRADASIEKYYEQRGKSQRQLEEWYLKNGYKRYDDGTGRSDQFFKKFSDNPPSHQGRASNAAFDPRRAQSAQILAQDIRGQIRFGDDRQFNIDLFKGRDHSTAVHEFAHFAFEVMGDLASDTDVAQSLKDDYQKLLTWAGVESRDQIGVEQHEKIARGFEAYLMEGKAPTKALRRVFATFKTWMTSVYRTVKGLDVELTDDVRAVFDRMLATEDEIASAMRTEAKQPLFGDPRAIGMSDEQALKYEKAVAASIENTDSNVRKWAMEDIRKVDEAYYKEAEERVRREVTAELEDTRDYRALNVLQGKAELNTVPLLSGVTDLKISKQSLIDMFGEDAVSQMPRGTTSKDGVHVESAAQLLDYADAQQLFDSLKNKPKLKDAVEARVKEEMAVQYPDQFNDVNLSDETVKALHNDYRKDVIRLEMDFLAENAPAEMKELARRLIGRARSDAALREAAVDAIGNLPIKDARVSTFRRAEVKASKAAAKAYASGNYSEAIEQKRLELLNHEMYREAVAAKEFVEKETKKLRRFNKSDEDIAKTRDVDVVIAARAVMAQFGLGSETKTPEEALRQMKAYDHDAYIHTISLINAAVRNIENPTGEFEDLKIRDFHALIDQTNALWEYAKSSREIERDGKKEDREKLVAEAVNQLGNFDKGGIPPGAFKQVTKYESFRKDVMGFINGYRRAESISLVLDQGDSRGIITKLLVRGVQNAQAKFMNSREDVKLLLDDMVKEVVNEKQVPVYSPELNYTFTGTREILGFMGHLGNASNIKKLLLGGRGNGLEWGTQNEDGTVDRSRLDAFLNRMHAEGVIQKKHWDIVQRWWDIHEHIKPDAQRAHKQLYGRYFDEITAQPIETPFGTYKGGYIAAITDPKIVAQTEKNEEQELAGLSVSFMLPDTGRGFTKGRVEGYNKPLLLDIGRAHSSMSKILRFTHLQPAVQEAVRILKNDQFVEAINRVDDTLIDSIYMPMLTRAALQTKVQPMTGAIGKRIQPMLNYLRRSASMQFLSVNMKNVTENFAVIGSIATRVPNKYLWQGMKSSRANPERSTQFIIESSGYMRTRIGSNADAVASAFDEFNEPSKFKKIQDVTAKWGMLLDRLTNNKAEKIAWIASYNWALDRGFSDADAVFEADSTVRQVTADATPASVSEFESGNALMQMFTMFSAFFNTQYNMQLSNASLAKQAGITSFKGSRLLLKSLIFGIFAEAAFGEMVRRAWGGNDLLDADDDGEYFDDVLDYFLVAPFKFATAMLPLGNVANHIVNQFNDKPYDDKFDAAPAISAASNAARLVKEVPAAIDGKNQGKAVQNFLVTAGLVTGIPLGVVGKPARYLLDVNEGKADPTGPVDIGRGLLTGKPGGPAK